MKHYPHHEAADKYPMIEGEAFEAFKADIKANGQRLPIYIQGGFIIDGRNRQKACAELGIEAVYQEVDGDPYELADSLNLHRRHLTKEQRNDMIVKKRSEGKSARQIGDEVGVDEKTVRNVIKSTAEKSAVDMPDEITGKDGKKRKAKATKKSTAYTETQLDEVATLLRQGKGEADIAKELDLTRFQARNRMANVAKELGNPEGDVVSKQEVVELQKKLESAITVDEVAELIGDAPTQAWFKKRIEKFEAKKLAEMQQEFQVELAAAVAAKQEVLDRLIESRRQEEHAAKQLRQQLMDARASVDRMMTYEEFKIVRGLLHPDRYPDDLKERAGKAFDIFNRLEKCVNPNIGVAELRKRGWEHLSPYGRKKSA